MLSSISFCEINITCPMEHVVNVVSAYLYLPPLKRGHGNIVTMCSQLTPTAFIPTATPVPCPHWRSLGPERGPRREGLSAALAGSGCLRECRGTSPTAPQPGGLAWLNSQVIHKFPFHQAQTHQPTPSTTPRRAWLSDVSLTEVLMIRLSCFALHSISLPITLFTEGALISA